MSKSWALERVPTTRSTVYLADVARANIKRVKMTNDPVRGIVESAYVMTSAPTERPTTLVCRVQKDPKDKAGATRITVAINTIATETESATGEVLSAPISAAISLTLPALHVEPDHVWNLLSATLMQFTASVAASVPETTRIQALMLGISDLV